ncbi:hypothetical protein GEMRC1_002183 [Eukaryota sp. GEM-RC1]
MISVAGSLLVLLALSFALPHHVPSEFSSYEVLEEKNNCHTLRLLLHNVEVTVSPSHKTTITYHSPDSSIDLSASALENAAHSCCRLRNLSVAPISLVHKSTAFHTSDTDIETLYMVPHNHPMNIFHLFLDFLLPFQYTAMRDGLSNKPHVLFLNCPSHDGLRKQFRSLIDPFVNKLDVPWLFPKRYMVRNLYIGLNTLPKKCRGPNSFSKQHCPHLFNTVTSKILQHLNVKPHPDPKFIVTLIDRYPDNRKIIGASDPKWVRAVQKSLSLIPSVHFRVVNNNQLSLQQQIRVAAESDVLVAVHGAALYTEMFLPNNSAVVVIYPPCCLNFVYNSMAKVLGLQQYNYTVSDSRIVPLSADAKTLLRIKSPCPQYKCNSAARNVDLNLKPEEFVDMVLPAIMSLKDG